MDQTRNEYGGFRGPLRPVGVVLRGIELRPLGASAEADRQAFTCILDGYVVYALEPVDAPEGLNNMATSNAQQSEQLAESNRNGISYGMPIFDATDQAPLGETPSQPFPPMHAQYAHYTYREDDDEGEDDGGDEDEQEITDDEGSDLGGDLDNGDDDIKASATSGACKMEHADADAPANPLPPAATSTGPAIRPYQPQPTRSRHQRVPGTVPPHMELSIRRKMGELGYKDDELVIFLVERFCRTALHKLRWLDTYKLQRMLDNGEIAATGTEIAN